MVEPAVVADHQGRRPPWGWSRRTPLACRGRATGRGGASGVMSTLKAAPRGRPCRRTVSRVSSQATSSAPGEPRPRLGLQHRERPLHDGPGARQPALGPAQPAPAHQLLRLQVLAHAPEVERRPGRLAGAFLVAGQVAHLGVVQQRAAREVHPDQEHPGVEGPQAVPRRVEAQRLPPPGGVRPPQPPSGRPSAPPPAAPPPPPSASGGRSAGPPASGAPPRSAPPSRTGCWPRRTAAGSPAAPGRAWGRPPSRRRRRPPGTPPRPPPAPARPGRRT